MIGPLLSAIVMWSHPGLLPTAAPAPPAAPSAAVTDAADATAPAEATPAPAAAPDAAAAPPAASAPLGDAASGLVTVPPAQLQPDAPPGAADAGKIPHDKTGDTIDEDVALFGTSGDAFSNGGQSEALSFRILLQARYADEWYISQPRDNSTDVARDIANATEDDGWRMNRLFLRAIARPRKWIQARLLVDFAELRWGNRRNTVKLAYLVVRPLPAHACDRRIFQAVVLVARAAADRRLRVRRCRPDRRGDQGARVRGPRHGGVGAGRAAGDQALAERVRGCVRR